VKQLLNPRGLWSLLPLVLAGWAVSGLYQVLPQVMQDEYVYSSQARNLPFEEHRFSNYLFSWAMGATRVCGDEFYGCVKAINTVFFLVAIVFTLLIALRYLSLGWAVFVSSITALSPLAIQVSFFMPETMYFMAMTITLWVTLRAMDSGTAPMWLVPGAALGLAALVKPHAIFLLPALLLFAVILEFRREARAPRSLLAGLAVASGFFFSKLLVGYLFAGQAGLQFFGGYGSPVERLREVVTETDSSTSNSSAVQDSSSGLVTLLSVGSGHLLAHVAVFALIAGIPLILAIRVSWRVLRTREVVSDASGFMFLITLLAGTMLALVPTFEAYVTANGDDHTLRLILRYYEFLIPSLLIAALMLSRFVESNLISRLIQASVVSVLSVGLAFVYPNQFDAKFADSSLLPGFNAYPSLFAIVAISVSAASIFWAVRPEEGSNLLTRVVIPVLLIVSMILSQFVLTRAGTGTAYFDVAGMESRTKLIEVDGDRIAVVGQTRPEVFTAKFWIDKAGIRDFAAVEGGTIDLQKIPGIEYVLLLGNITAVGTYQVIHEGDRFTLIQLLTANAD
jgi:phosphoglycerol transferase